MGSVDDWGDAAGWAACGHATPITVDRASRPAPAPYGGALAAAGLALGPNDKRCRRSHRLAWPAWVAWLQLSCTAWPSRLQRHAKAARLVRSMFEAAGLFGAPLVHCGWRGLTWVR